MYDNLIPMFLTLEQGLALLWLIITFLVFGSAQGKAKREGKKLDYADNMLLLIASLMFSSNLIWGFFSSVYYVIFKEFPPFAVPATLIGAMMIVGSIALLYGLYISIQRVIEKSEE